jgi:hypothetical protein
MTTIFLVLVAVVFYHVIIRVAVMTKQAKEPIRYAVLCVGWAVLFGVYQLANGWTPDLQHLLILGALCGVLCASAKQWRRGMPKQFVKSTAAESVLPVIVAGDYVGHDRRGRE